MSAREELHALTESLRNPLHSPALPAERQQEIQLRGILALLEEIASGPDLEEDQRQMVIEALRQTAAVHPLAGPREQAYRALIRLVRDAAVAAPRAIDALYQLALEDEYLAARQLIAAEGWQPTRPGLRALFDWFAPQTAGTPYPQESLPALTEGFFEDASPALQRRVLSAAAQNQAGNWERIAAAVQHHSPASLTELVERYPTFTPTERQIALELLARLAAAGSVAARDALAQLFIRLEDPQARQLIFKRGYFPEDPQQRALVYFLAGVWDEYERLDFDRRLLINAYESAGRSLRRRLLEHSRHTGQMDWLREASSASEVRWIGDLTDADWNQTLHHLLEQAQYSELWRLAQAAPPVWSAAILDQLANRGWQPFAAEDQSGFERLARTARECLAAPLALRPKQVLQADAELTCLALSADGRLLAGGASNDQRIFLWGLPDGFSRSPLIGPAPVTRAVGFAPGGEFLAAAGGDHRIRVFRLQGGQVVKVLEGHQAMIRSLAFHPEGRVLYSAGFDGSLRFWRFPYGPEIKTLRPGPGEIFNMVAGAGGLHLISGGADCLVRVWSLPEGAAARDLPGHKDTITSLAASPASELIASAGRDGTVRVWNYASGRSLRVIENSSPPITALCLHPNEQVLIGGHASGQITLWSLSTGRVLDQTAAHARAISGMVLDPQGERLYSADASGVIHKWDLKPFLTVRLPGEPSRPGTAVEEEQLRNSPLTGAEKQWLRFSAELARWRQRYDIELADFNPIRVGEFDIEL